MVNLFLIFLVITILFSITAAPFYIPTNSAQGFQFLHILASTCYFPLLSFVCMCGFFFFFNISYPSSCEVNLLNLFPRLNLYEKALVNKALWQY